MNQLKAIIAAGTLTGIILVTAIAFGVRGLNGAGLQNAGGNTTSAPAITQFDTNMTLRNQPSYENGEHEAHEHGYDEYDND